MRATSPTVTTTPKRLSQSWGQPLRPWLQLQRGRTTTRIRTRTRDPNPIASPYPVDSIDSKLKSLNPKYPTSKFPVPQNPNLTSSSSPFMSLTTLPSPNGSSSISSPPTPHMTRPAKPLDPRRRIQDPRWPLAPAETLPRSAPCRLHNQRRVGTQVLHIWLLALPIPIRP